MSGLLWGFLLVMMVGLNLVICYPRHSSTTITTCSRMPYQPFPPQNWNHPPLEYSTCKKDISASRNLRDPNISTRGPQIITENGYTVKTYHSVTPDGYILQTFRISGGPRKLLPSFSSFFRTGNAPPSVLLWHGYGGSAEQWIVQPGRRNLAFMLVDAGYDVWLVNNRGADFSQGHVTIPDPQSDVSYWDFSFQEMASIDLPLLIDLVLRESGNEKIFYIGFSQGASVFLAGLSEHAELNEKFGMGILLAPAVFIESGYGNELYFALANVSEPSRELIYQNLTGFINQMDPSPIPILDQLLPSRDDVCGSSSTWCGICTSGSGSRRPMYELDPTQTNYTNLPFALSKMFNFGGFKGAFHLSQLMNSCSFRKYDYGAGGNYMRYGSVTPPDYDLTRLSTPLHLFYGNYDSTVTPAGVQRLSAALRPGVVRGVHRINWDYFNHLDFISGTDADDLLYKDVVAMLNVETYRQRLN